MLKDLVKKPASSTSTENKDHFKWVFDEDMGFFLGRTPPDVDGAITFIEALADEVPHVEVNMESPARAVIEIKLQSQ